MNGNTVRLYWSAAESDKYVNYLTGTNVYGEITADVSTDDHYKINQEIDKNYFQNGVWTHEEGVSPATPIDISTDPGYTFFGDTEIRYNNNNLEYRKKSYTLTIVGGVIQPKAGDWGDWTNILTTSPFTCPQ